MRNKLWRSLVLFATIGYVVSLTITSSPRLGVDTVCDNHNVTLMCHIDTCDMITWYWSNQSQHGDNITVVASRTEVVYTCVVSKDGHHLEKNVTVVASGAPPFVEAMFPPYVYAYRTENLTLITKIFSDLPVLSIKWVGFHRPLPSTSVVDNYTTGGVLYSRLSLYELSFEDDSGNYTNIVSNQCGSSSVFVFLEAHRVPDQCLNYGSLAPLLSGPKDHITVGGETISFECHFRGSYDEMKHLSYSIIYYWVVKPQNSEEPLIISANTTYDSYWIAIYQTCLTANFSCCEFVSRLTIIDTSMSMDGAEVQCYEFLQHTADIDQQTSANSSLTVCDQPEVVNGPKNVRASAGATVNFSCNMKSPTMTGVSIIVWLKDDFQVTESSHYTITTTADPLSKDLISTTLAITSVTTEDNGKYTCYCYYNRSMVTSSKYVTSNQKSAKLHVKSGSELSDDSKMAIIIASSVATLIVAVLWAVVIMAYVVCSAKNKSPKLVNLAQYSEDDEKRPLLEPPQEETDKRDYRIEYANDRSTASLGYHDRPHSADPVIAQLQSLPPSNNT